MPPHKSGYVVAANDDIADTNGFWPLYLTGDWRLIADDLYGANS